jgi:hypothetical protein
MLQEWPATFGEAVVRTKWRTRYNDDEFRQMVDSVASLFVTAAEMLAVRDSHMYSYNLLGDPALALRFPPAAVQVQVSPDPVSRGSPLTVSGAVAGLAQGTAHVTIEVDRLTLLGTLLPVTDPWDPAAQDAIQDNHAMVMERVVASVDLPVAAGAFSGTITVPAGMPPGYSYVKVRADDGVIEGLGHVSVVVQ